MAVSKAGASEKEVRQIVAPVDDKITALAAEFQLFRDNLPAIVAAAVAEAIGSGPGGSQTDFFKSEGGSTFETEGGVAFETEGPRSGGPQVIAFVTEGGLTLQTEGGNVLETESSRL